MTTQTSKQEVVLALLQQLNPELDDAALERFAELVHEATPQPVKVQIIPPFKCHWGGVHEAHDHCFCWKENDNFKNNQFKNV